MYGVDTLDLSWIFRKHIEWTDEETGERIRLKELDIQYIKPIDEKIRSKLYLDKQNQQNQQREDRYNQMSREGKFALFKLIKKRDGPSINYKGKYGGYTFYYNSKWNSLKIHLSHKLVEDYDTDEIINNVKDVIVEFFEIDRDIITNLTLTRLDVKNDFRCDDEGDKRIIKNIISKATQRYRSYNKEVEDTETKYIVNYINRKEEDKHGEEKQQKGQQEKSKQ